MTPLNLSRTWARTWTDRIQQQARRNAMVALTECTQRRAEREDVEHFLAVRADAASGSRKTSVPLHA